MKLIAIIPSHLGGWGGSRDDGEILIGLALAYFAVGTAWLMVNSDNIMAAFRKWRNKRKKK